MWTRYRTVLRIRALQFGRAIEPLPVYITAVTIGNLRSRSVKSSGGPTRRGRGWGRTPDTLCSAYRPGSSQRSPYHACGALRQVNAAGPVRLSHSSNSNPVTDVSSHGKRIAPGAGPRLQVAFPENKPRPHRLFFLCSRPSRSDKSLLTTDFRRADHAPANRPRPRLYGSAGGGSAAEGDGYRAAAGPRPWPTAGRSTQ